MKKNVDEGHRNGNIDLIGQTIGDYILQKLFRDRNIAVDRFNLYVNNKRERERNSVEENHHIRDLISQKRNSSFHNRRKQLFYHHKIDNLYEIRRTTGEIELFVVSFDGV